MYICHIDVAIVSSEMEGDHQATSREISDSCASEMKLLATQLKKTHHLFTTNICSCLPGR